jgi:hypothetical protein
MELDISQSRKIYTFPLRKAEAPSEQAQLVPVEVIQG